MTREEADEFIKSDEGAAWLNEQKQGLVNKRDELLATVKELTAKNTEAGQRVHDMESLLTSEREAVKRLAVDEELEKLMTEHKVQDRFRADVRTLLRSSFEVAIKADGQQRVAMVGEKTLSDSVSEWAKSEEAKKYIMGSQNSGGGAPGSAGRGGGTMVYNRATIENMKPEEVAAKLDDPAFRDSVAKLTSK